MNKSKAILSILLTIMCVGSSAAIPITIIPNTSTVAYAATSSISSKVVDKTNNPIYLGKSNSNSSYKIYKEGLRVKKVEVLNQTKDYIKVTTSLKYWDSQKTKEDKAKGYGYVLVKPNKAGIVQIKVTYNDNTVEKYKFIVIYEKTYNFITTASSGGSTMISPRSNKTVKNYTVNNNSIKVSLNRKTKAYNVVTIPNVHIDNAKFTINYTDGNRDVYTITAKRKIDNGIFNVSMGSNKSFKLRNSNISNVSLSNANNKAYYKLNGSNLVVYITNVSKNNQVYNKNLDSYNIKVTVTYKNGDIDIYTIHPTWKNTNLTYDEYLRAGTINWDNKVWTWYSEYEEDGWNGQTATGFQKYYTKMSKKGYGGFIKDKNGYIGVAAPLTLINSGDVKYYDLVMTPFGMGIVIDASGGCWDLYTNCPKSKFKELGI